MTLAPWNASWTGEHRYEVRPCRYASGARAIWQPHAPGSGRPMFAEPHVVRQRRSIAEMRCTVCGAPTGPASRVHFGLGQYEEIDGRIWWITTEAPVHPECAERALKVCPHLRTLGRTPKPWPAAGWSVLAALVGGERFAHEFDLFIPADRPVIGHLKLALPSAPEGVA